MRDDDDDDEDDDSRSFNLRPGRDWGFLGVWDIILHLEDADGWHSGPGLPEIHI